MAQHKNWFHIARQLRYSGVHSRFSKGLKATLQGRVGYGWLDPSWKRTCPHISLFSSLDQLESHAYLYPIHFMPVEVLLYQVITALEFVDEGCAPREARLKLLTYWMPPGVEFTQLKLEQVTPAGRTPLPLGMG